MSRPDDETRRAVMHDLREAARLSAEAADIRRRNLRHMIRDNEFAPGTPPAAPPTAEPSARVVRFRQAIPGLGILAGDRIVMMDGTALLCRDIPVEVARALGAVEALETGSVPALSVLRGGAQ